MKQHQNQLDTEIRIVIFPLEYNETIPAKFKENVLPQQVAISQFSNPTPFVFHVITGRQKRAFNTDAISFTENLRYISLYSLPFEKHCSDTYSISLIREHHDSYLYYIFYHTCESSFSDVHLTVVFNPV